MIFPSIRSFLAFTNTVVVILIMSILGLGIQSLVGNRLHSNLDQDLKQQASTISSYIVQNMDADLSASINRLVIGLNVANSGGNVTYVQLYTSSGTPIPLSGTPSPIPVASSKQLHAVNGTPVHSNVTSSKGIELRVLTEKVMYHDQTLAYVQVARDLQPINEILAQLRQTLITGIILAGAIAGAFSYALAWQALKPFSEIVSDAEMIGVDDLGRRLPANYGVEEVGKLASSFNSLLERLQQAFNLQRRFVADASHELRTPLTSIRGNIDVMLLDPDLPPYLRDSLQNLSGEAGRLSRLVTNLLLLARAESGQYAALQKPVDLHGLVLEAIMQIRATAPAVHIGMRHEDQVTVAGDSDLLRQVLLNLLDNAVKYTPRGGEVRVGVYKEDSWAKVEIQDTGIGMSPEDMEQIFDRFFRSERTRQEAIGSGLGLSIVYWVITAHHGRITVDSKPGQGSLFTVWLPLVPNERTAFLTIA